MWTWFTASAGLIGYEIGPPLATWGYHALLAALLVAATFIDYDLFIIPDQITVTGMVLGIGLGTLAPWIRPVPAAAASHLQGFWAGLLGLLIGAGLTQDSSAWQAPRSSGVRPWALAM